MLSIDAAARQRWLSVLAKSPGSAVAAAWSAFPAKPDAEIVRSPEYGAILVQARADRNGPLFYFGEMTVTRMVIALADGRIGVGYVPGCNDAHAMAAAMFDALLQGVDEFRDRANAVVADLAAAEQRRKAVARAHTARTKVDFAMKAQDE